MKLTHFFGHNLYDIEIYLVLLSHNSLKGLVSWVDEAHSLSDHHMARHCAESSQNPKCQKNHQAHSIDLNFSVLRVHLKQENTHFWCSVLEKAFEFQNRSLVVFVSQYDGTNLWGDLLRSVPFIMCGHLNIDFFQASAASILTRYPLRTCLMVILRHSGRAPKHFVHPLHGMSHHEMSRHDTQNLKLLF